MTDPKQIAASLTKAQREAVLSASQTIGGAYQVWASHRSTIKSLFARGLCTEPTYRVTATETPLGQQVRDIIKEQEQ